MLFSIHFENIHDVVIKKSLNRFALSKKSVRNLLFTRRDGIKGIFQPLANVFESNQQVFGAVGSLSLTASLSWYFDLGKLVKFGKL